MAARHSGCSMVTSLFLHGLEQSMNKFSTVDRRASNLLKKINVIRTDFVVYIRAIRKVTSQLLKLPA